MKDIFDTVKIFVTGKNWFVGELKNVGHKKQKKQEEGSNVTMYVVSEIDRISFL